jgi:glycosyl hydrolase family 18 (putative chitinase)
MKKVLLMFVICFAGLICQNLIGAENSKVIGGYWENWKGPIDPGPGTTSDASYYMNDIKNFNHVYYSFLTLDKTPNPNSPQNIQWDGRAIYESMTQHNVIDVMTKTDPLWANPYEWQRAKIAALIDACHQSGAKFIWAIGGWSDLTKTVTDEQVTAFVSQCVKLLKITGDGIDFDWEHLSNNPDIESQQRRVLGKIFPALRKALDVNGMSDKEIGYTTRFNAFWKPPPSGVTAFPSDGEGVDVNDQLSNDGSSFKESVNWVNIMMYDCPPSDLGAPDNKLTLENYKQVLSYFEKYMPKNLIVMGFEPGGQASGGNWEGMNVDKEVIDYIQQNSFGGVMFWAVNQPPLPPSTENTGKNSQILAAYAASKFDKKNAAWVETTMQIVNNFKSSNPNAANYFSKNYSDEQAWLYFLNTKHSVTYMDNNNTQQTVQDKTSIQLSTVKDGKFILAIGGDSAKVFAGLGTTTPFSGDNGPGVFDNDVPYALAEWTINGNEYDNTDLSYEDAFSFPTRMTVKNASGEQTKQASFQSGTQAEDVINTLKAAMPNKPVGPLNDNYPTSGAVGWGPLVPAVYGNANASRWIGSSKTWISGPDSNNLRSMYIYAPSLNDYLKFLQDNETSQFSNGISGWFIDYSGNGGYSGYLSITGSDQNYGLHIHDIRVNTSPTAANNWKADPNAGTATTGDIIVTTNNATIPFNDSAGSTDTSNVTGLWTDGVIYSGAALVGDLGDGPVITGTGDFATGAAQNAIVPSMLASISASMATGILGSDMYNNKLTALTPGSTMYWFQTLTRTQSTQKLFDKAWSKGQKFYDPFWKTMAELTHMQGYLSPFNDRWSHFSPDFPLGANYTIIWELGIPTERSSGYTISGTISGTVKNGVTLSLSGASTATTTTEADGSYSFSDIPNGMHIITPSLSDYTFSPSHSSVTIAEASQSTQNFEVNSIDPNTHSIKGMVSGDITENVKISLSGASTDTTTTAAGGTYSFANLVNGDYTVTPSLSGYTFSPSSSSVTISDADNIESDFTATGGYVALGMQFVIEATDIPNLPTPGKFMVKPKVYAEYDILGKEGEKNHARVLTNPDNKTGSSFVKCLWTKKIRLYDKKSFKKAKNQGISAATWVANSENQKTLHMILHLISKEVDTQSVHPLALGKPVINGIFSGGKDAKGNDTLIIAGQWFGTKLLRISREFTLGEAIKQQKMKVVKPTKADAAAGYKDIMGNPSFMNAETGASKVVVIIPSKLPKGPVNGVIVLNNRVGIATGSAPSN